MYSIYVNNKYVHNVYARLSSEKIQYSDSYVQKINEEILDKEEKEREKEYISFLAVGGFRLIRPGKTLAFSVGNVDASMYVSVVCLPKIWIANFPFDPKMFGCLVIWSEQGNILVTPHNPKASWVPGKKGDKLVSNFIESGSGLNVGERLYFGRTSSYGGIPCAASISDKICNGWLMANNKLQQSGDLLKNTGCELIQAKHGDPIPPNAVMTGVTEADGSLYVGRVGGSIPCYIATEDGKIKCFVYLLCELDKEKRVGNGEILVLTA